MIQFDLPKEQSSILKVIGIGGGGGNAVNHMFSQNIDGVNFIICNTDAQALAISNVPNKIQLGPHLTQGLGAGANPEIGREATQESLEEIKRILEVNTKMAFITAGMGGGTGTGGAPIIAKICKDLGILTVGIVTTPFNYEGKKRMAQAQEGIEILKEHVDTLLVISNDKLRHQFGNLTMKAAFAKADNVLATAAKCITDVINSTGQINVDFADVCTVMRNGGVAILGNAECEGENRAQKAIEQALNSPLLNDNDISGAKWILININSAEGEHEFTMDEVDTIQTHLLSKAGENSDVILGLGYDKNLENKIGITVIATGFDDDAEQEETEAPAVEEEKKEILQLKPLERKTGAQPLFLFDQNEGHTAEESSTEPREEVPADGLRKEKVIEALKSEEVKHISEELKPELQEQKEPKKSILDLTPERPAPVATEPPRDVVIFDLYSDTGTEARRPEVPPSDSSAKGSSTAMPDPENKTAPAAAQPSMRPSHVYVERAPGSAHEKPQPPKVEEQISDDIHKFDFHETPEPPKASESLKEEEEPLNEEMRLVEKDTPPVPGNDEPRVRQAMPVIFSEDEEEPPVVDEAEEQKRKTLDRLHKLRNLSYNPNSADATNEFESVPAYLRRNLELHNSIANVESFYTNYSVGPDENSKAKINTINSFLQGKKPD